MRNFFMFLVTVIGCLIYAYSYAGSDDATIVYKDSQRTIRAVCVHGMQFLVNDQGELTQVLTPVVDTITTYENTNGNWYPRDNKVRSAVPAACKNIYPGAKAPY